MFYFVDYIITDIVPNYPIVSYHYTWVPIQITGIVLRQGNNRTAMTVNATNWQAYLMLHHNESVCNSGKTCTVRERTSANKEEDQVYINFWIYMVNASP